MTSPSLLDGLQIRRFGAADSIDDLTDLLHRAYKQLADMGLNYTAADQPTEVTARRIADRECYVCLLNGLVIGTGTLTAPGRPPSDHAWLARPHVARFGQFGVEPACQHKGIGSALLTFLEHRATELGATELALDTAEPAKHLIDFYRRRGYRIVDQAQWDGKTYASVIMSKRLTERHDGE